MKDYWNNPKAFTPMLELVSWLQDKAPHRRGLIRAAVFQGESQWPQINPPKGETEAKGVSLMRSDRGKHGMIYTELGRV